MVKTLCQTYDIILLQEHWLLVLLNNLYKIDDIDNAFQSYGVSSMNSKVQSGI